MESESVTKNLPQPVKCPSCKGKGEIEIAAFFRRVTCPVCNGAGKTDRKLADDFKRREAAGNGSS